MAITYFNCFRQGEHVRISVDDADTRIQRHFWLKCSDALEARLVVRWVNEEMRTRIKAIRENAYEQGRKSARSKADKVEHFSGCINSTDCTP